MICGDPIRITFYLDLIWSLQVVGIKIPLDVELKVVKIWGGSLLESQCRSLQFVETLWESLVCGSQQISTLFEDQLWTTFFYFVGWCWQWLLAGCLCLWISELFQRSFHRNFVRLICYTVCWLVKEFTVKRFIKKIGGRGVKESSKVTVGSWCHSRRSWLRCQNRNRLLLHTDQWSSLKVDIKCRYDKSKNDQD